MSTSAVQPTPPARPGGSKPKLKARINLRALLVILVVVALAVPVYLGVQTWQDSRSGSGVKRLAKDFLNATPPKPDLAIKYLDRYLELVPKDPEALTLKARLLSDAARDPDAVAGTIKFVDFVERNLADGPDRQEIRRQLVELYLRKGTMTDPHGTPIFAPQDVEYRTAEAIARGLLAQDASDKTNSARDHRLLARSLLGVDAQGEPKALAEAAKELERAIQLDPTNVEGVAELANLEAGRLNQPARADVLLDALIKAAPTAPAYLARVQHYARFGPPIKARAELDAAIKRFPKDLELVLIASGLALDRNELGVARGYLDGLTAEARDTPKARLVRGVLELREHRTDAAIADWRQGLLHSGGNDVDLSFRLAVVLLQLGRVEEARPLMEQVKRLTSGDKPSAQYRFLEALALLQARQPAPALEILEDLRNTIDRGLLAPLCMTIAGCYESARDEPRALEAYRAAAVAQPRMVDAYLNASRILARISGSDAAADELVMALKKVPDDTRLLLGLARLRIQKTQWVDAKALLDRAAQLAPGAPGLIMLQGDYLAGTGRLDEAVKMLGRAAQQGDRKDPSLWLAYANGLSRQGRLNDALQVLERASGPEAAGDRAALRITRARFLQQAGRGRLARQELEREVESLPPAERPEVLRARGELLNLQGDRAAALAALKLWSEAAPENPEPALALLDLALNTNDESSAAAAMKALAAIHQGDGAYEAIGRAFESLRRAVDPNLAPNQRLTRLDATDQIVGEILERAPRLPQGYLMRGLILEERAKLREETQGTRGGADPARDELLNAAIDAFGKALDNGGVTAVPRLVELLTRRKRVAELAILRKRVAADTMFDRLSIDAALRFGLPNEAQEIARKVVEGAPEDLDARRILADVLKRLGKPDEAEEALRDLARQRPGEPGPWLQLLVLQVGLNRKEAAKQTLGQIVRNVKGTNADFIQAQAYWMSGDTDRAGEAFARALKDRPDDPVIARKAVDFDEAVGKSAEAEALLRRTLKANPSASWAARKLAMILSGRAGNLEAWMESSNLVAAPDSAAVESPEDRLARAIVLSRSPDPATNAGAVPLLRSLKDDLPPTNPIGREARQRLTRFFLEADRPQEAWGLAGDSTAQDTDLSPDMIALHAEVLLANKRPDDAEAEIRRLEALEPKSLRAEILRARLMAVRGEPEKADEALERIFDQRSTTADDAATTPAVLTALVGQDRLDAAERVARKEAQARPTNGWMLGRVLARRKRTAEAEAACLAAAQAGAARSAAPVAMSIAVSPGADAATLDGADAVLEEALKANPGAADLLMQRAQLRHVAKRFDDEVKIYRDLNNRFPGDHAFLNNWAWTLSESLHKPEDALKLVQEAIRRSGRQPVYLDTEGVILDRLNRHSEAIALLSESAPGVAGGQGFLHLAEAQHHAGQDGAARQSLDRARAFGLKAEGLDDEVRNRLESLDSALPPAAPTTPKPKPAENQAPKATTPRPASRPTTPTGS